MDSFVLFPLTFVDRCHFVEFTDAFDHEEQRHCHDGKRYHRLDEFAVANNDGRLILVDEILHLYRQASEIHATQQQAQWRRYNIVD